jgi:hypothetical protein
MTCVNFIKSNFLKDTVHLTANAQFSSIYISFESILLLALSFIHFFFILGFHIYPLSPSSSPSFIFHFFKYSLTLTVPLLLHIFLKKISLSLTLLLPLPFSRFKFSLFFTPPLPLPLCSSPSPVFFLLSILFFYF